jgi:DNA-binding transcriptional LysR family regulator
MEVSQFLTVELRALRWAIAISQHRSLRQAAETLNIRHSTLSRRLRDVEGRLGANLFERTNGGTQPTIAGLEFIETDRRILDDIDSAVRRLNARSHGEIGRLRIGVYASLVAVTRLRRRCLLPGQRAPDAPFAEGTFSGGGRA